MFSLIHDSWLPVRDKNGHYRRIPPVEILDETIVDLAWTRADFQTACLQWLIGILQATIAPEDNDEWEDIWENNPDSELFAERLADLAPAFRFGSEKPAFMQDFASLEGEAVPIAGLLIDAPTGITLTHNKDLFFKRGTVKHICPRCAAMALFTLQINAPSGGQGHRTGLRGGGPITTLVWSKEPDTPLWRRLWLNVLTHKYMPASSSPVDAARFPWCGATRTSERENAITTPKMVDKQQVYWGMPRRIEIDFSQLSAGECSLCGDHSEQLLTRYRTKNYGIKYDGWVHPLTPYRKKGSKNSVAPMFSVKGQPGGLLYRDWLGLLWQGNSEGNLEYPAHVVTQMAELPLDHVSLGLLCFGFDTDNMKVRCWYQHQLPLLYVSADMRGKFFGWLRQAVQAARAALSDLTSALKKAERQQGGAMALSFWQETEPGFIRLLEDLQVGFNQHPVDFSALKKWRNYLRSEVVKRFDALVLDNPPEQPEGIRQAILARQELCRKLNKSTVLQALNITNTKGKK